MARPRINDRGLWKSSILATSTIHKGVDPSPRHIPAATGPFNCAREGEPTAPARVVRTGAIRHESHAQDRCGMKAGTTVPGG
jgi:hypothetical protein